MAQMTCKPNPDVAGPGVIYSFVISAVLTIALSITTLILRYSQMKKENLQFASLVRRQPNANQPFWARHWHFLRDDHPLWTPCRDKKHGKRAVWYRIIDQLLVSLALTQLLNGFAMQVCTMVWYGRRFETPHQLLAHLLTVLSVFSQLPVTFVVENVRKRSAVLRVMGGLLFQLLMFTDIFLFIASGRPRTDFGRSVLVFFLAMTPYSAMIIVSSIAFLMGTFTSPYRPRVPKLLRSRPTFLFAYTALAMPVIMLATVYIFVLKYVPEAWEGCSLNTPADNQWTMGQMLPLVMLPGLVLPALDIYFEEHEAVSHLGPSELEPLLVSGRTEQELNLDFEPDSQPEFQNTGATTTAIQDGYTARRAATGLEDQD